MVELIDDGLNFSFPEVHPLARLRLEFQRTLRIPDDDSVHHLPPGLGTFPLRHVDDFRRVPPAWVGHGGVLLPMYQSEALWIRLAPTWPPDRESAYPFAVKVAAGKIDAVTGQSWSNELHARPQDYLVAPHQPWLDGFAVEKGVIRQFVAMPLGGGYTAEEQITGTAEHGGLQIVVYPMKRDVFERRFPKVAPQTGAWRVGELGGEMFLSMEASVAEHGMGLAPGGRMTQEIYTDRFGLADWDQTARSRCFVHLANSLVWEAITGDKPPTPPPTARHYTDQGLPWFDYYAEGQTALDGAETLRRLRSVLEKAAEKGEPALPENESVSPENVVRITGKRSGQVVREGVWG